MDDQRLQAILQEMEADGGTQDWLISYADMMTLIANFFILMLAFANFDPIGFNDKAEKLSKAFRKDEFKTSVEEKFDKIKEELSVHPEMQKKLKMSLKDGGLLITFTGTVLFGKNQYKVSEENEMVLDAMIDIIKSQSPAFRILVEGHTDSDKEGRKKFFESDWMLSSARAAAIIERFQYFGFNPANLVAIGHGSTQPIIPEKDSEGAYIEENLEQNRRVTIKVLRPLEKGQTKFGLGGYFQDSTNSEAEKSRFIDQEYKVTK